MNRFLGYVCFLIFLPITLFAQDFQDDGAKVISDRLDDLRKDYTFTQVGSSVLDTLVYNKYNFRSNEVPTYSAATLEQRLYEIPTVIPLDFNRHVQRYIELYTKHRRGQTARMLGLQEVYFPIFEEELDKAGLPMEIKYLSIVESALNPHARSRVGATGLWQFMLSTGRQYGLKVNSFIDERKDPFKSTRAAVNYLQDAHDEFDDWLLAIASYNCGIGNVRKAIYRSGGKRNFWAIMPYLPRETRGYVPAFIAAIYFSNYSAEHNIYPVHVDVNYLEDSVQIRKMDISLQEIANMAGVSFQALRNLNPELKLSRVPYTNEPYILRVPKRVGEYFAQNESKIRDKYGKKQGSYASSAAYSKKYVSNSSKNGSSPKPSGKLVYYTVRSGDVVGTIAERFHVSPRSISRWNGLRNYRIRVGQKLKIYTNFPSTGATSTSSNKNTNTTTASGAVYHTVRSGDTLWDISQKYSGVSISKIQRLNPGLNSRKIKIGQKIRVK